MERYYSFVVRFRTPPSTPERLSTSFKSTKLFYFNSLAPGTPLAFSAADREGATSMDRELEASYRYRRLGRRAAWGLGGIALCMAILVLLPGWLRPSVARAEIRTGRVDRGPVEGIVEANGVVHAALRGERHQRR